MRLQVTVYSITGDRLQVLTQAQAITANRDSLSFSLPKDDSFISYFDGDVALAVEVEALGDNGHGPTTFGRLTYGRYGEVDTRYIYQGSDQSPTDQGALWGFTAPSIAAAAFPKMPILPELGHTLTYNSTATPASVIANRVLEAKNRGYDLGITVVDGGGWSAPNVATGIAFDPLDTLDGFYTGLLSGVHADLFWVGTTLYVLPPGTMALDRTTLSFQLKSFSDVQTNIDRSNMADTIAAQGDNGSRVLYPPTAPGRVLIVQFSGISDAATLTEVAKDELANRQKPLRQITATLALGENPTLMPYRDYHRGSIIRFPKKGGGSENVGVADVTLTRGDKVDLGGNIVLDTTIKDLTLRLVELGKLGVGVSTVVSGSGSVLKMPNPVDTTSSSLGSGVTGSYRLERDGKKRTLSWHLYQTTISAGTVILTVASADVPAGGDLFVGTGALYTPSGWTAAPVFIDAVGNLKWLAAGQTEGSGTLVYYVA